MVKPPKPEAARTSQAAYSKDVSKASPRRRVALGRLLEAVDAFLDTELFLIAIPPPGP
jgi:hypothetical protein